MGPRSRLDLPDNPVRPNPSPEQVQQAMAKIRKSWSPDMRNKKAVLAGKPEVGQIGFRIDMEQRNQLKQTCEDAGYDFGAVLRMMAAVVIQMPERDLHWFMENT